MSNTTALGIITWALITGSTIFLFMDAATGRTPVLATMLTIAAVGTAKAQARHTDK